MTGAAPAPVPARDLARLVETALTEDLGGDPGTDVTTEATVPPDAVATVTVRSRAGGVLAGGVAWPVLTRSAARRTAGSAPDVELLVPDGQPVSAGQAVAVLRGQVRALLVAERSGLNLVGRASGIATATRAWVTALRGTGVTVLDTRKTAPGLRVWDKYAVRCGGGVNKRLGLHDAAMIKDNHVAAAGGVGAAIAAVRRRHPDLPLEVEVETLDEVREAVTAGARYLMCDNMTVGGLRDAVAVARSLTREIDGRDGTVEVEATGGLLLGTVGDVAACGVDHVSVGALTHSAPTLDVGLDWGS